MQAMNTQDLKWCLNRLPEKIRTAMIGAVGYTPVVAGGFIRACVANETVNDIDMFIAGDRGSDLELAKTQAKGFACELAITNGKPPHESPNAFSTTVSKFPVQVIHRWVFQTVEAVISSLDFTICHAGIYYDGKNWIGLVGDSFYQDLAAKRLNYTSPVRDEDAGGSMLRVLKYYQRGYRIPLGSLGMVLARMISGLKEEDLKKRYAMDRTTWEQAVGLVMTGLLKEVDPQIDPTHVAHLP